MNHRITIYAGGLLLLALTTVRAQAQIVATQNPTEITVLDATTVFAQAMAGQDTQIPRSVLANAQGIAIVPGMVRGQRFRYSAEQIRLPAGAPQPAPMPHFEHLTVYEIRGPLDVTLAGLKAGRESGEICSTDTLDPVANRGLLYTAHRPPLDAGR